MSAPSCFHPIKYISSHKYSNSVFLKHFSTPRIGIILCGKRNNSLCSMIMHITDMCQKSIISPDKLCVCCLVRLVWKRVNTFPSGVKVDWCLGGGGTPLYKLYRYARPQRVGFFRRFATSFPGSFSLA